MKYLLRIAAILIIAKILNPIAAQTTTTNTIVLRGVRIDSVCQDTVGNDLKWRKDMFPTAYAVSKYVAAKIAAAPFITTETDPTVPSYVKAITPTNISNWNTTYVNGWGLTQQTVGSTKTFAVDQSLVMAKATADSTVAAMQANMSNQLSGKTDTGSGYSKSDVNTLIANNPGPQGPQGIQGATGA